MYFWQRSIFFSLENWEPSASLPFFPCYFYAITLLQDKVNTCTSQGPAWPELRTHTSPPSLIPPDWSPGSVVAICSLASLFCAYYFLCLEHPHHFPQLSGEPLLVTSSFFLLKHCCDCWFLFLQQSVEEGAALLTIVISTTIIGSSMSYKYLMILVPYSAWFHTPLYAWLARHEIGLLESWTVGMKVRLRPRLRDC